MDIISGGIWRTQPVTAQPQLTLHSWQVFETVDEHKTRHFVGYCDENREGRVSSSIVTYDPQTKRGVTQTGRVYELLGAPGHHVDADYVLGAWLQMNKVEEIKYVSDELDVQPT